MRRITLTTIASGQPRPYADSRLIVQIKFEVFFAWLGDPNHEKSKWKPDIHWTKEEVGKALEALKCGFPGLDTTPANWAAPHLQYLKEIKEDRTPVVAGDQHTGIWEFHTTSAYTD